MTAGPHIETFDRYDYNFNGTCVYELAGVCVKDPSLQQFRVLVQIVDSGATLVEVNIHGSSIVITRGIKDSVLINGKNTSLPFRGNVTVRQFDDHAEIQTKFGVHVSYNWNSTVKVKVPSTYAGAMCGLCGNYNTNPKDDLRLKNGTRAVSADELGKSWRENDRSCQESATCTISGDPHYKNFKQHYFDFQGTCSYTAAKLCLQEKSHHHNFSVVVENEKWTMTDKPNLAVATLVAVEVYGHTLILRRNQLQSLMVDDILTNIPFNLNDGQVKVFQEGFAYAIVVDFGLKVTYDMIYKIEIIIPANLINKTCGLCGSFYR
ncbi:IgGFc-binding protein-like [Hippoglossus hippoglossus]|uniref:IgGFc-binding protein-like n=1 Tax=Hippoglossus hippoglossus TaxID=8267 RepID=UPI00148C98D1|nr:IgGFc-binding protein-like [Hippoglossus hippoglossus]